MIQVARFKIKKKTRSERKIKGGRNDVLELEGKI